MVSRLVNIEILLSCKIMKLTSFLLRVATVIQPHVFSVCVYMLMFMYLLRFMHMWVYIYMCMPEWQGQKTTLDVIHFFPFLFLSFFLSIFLSFIFFLSFLRQGLSLDYSSTID